MIKVPVPPIVTPVIRQIAAASLLALTLGSAQASIMIDNFTNDQLVRDPPGADDVTSSNLTGGAFIGSSRDLTIARNGTLGSAYAASNSVNPEMLVIGNSGSATSVVSIQWNGIDDRDFTDGGALGLYVAFANPIDHALTITFQVIDDLVTATASRTFPNLSQGGGFFFAFTSFLDGNGVADPDLFKSVNTLRAAFTSSIGNMDANISYIKTTDVPVVDVPVPGVLALMVLGLTGLRVTRRRPA